MVQMAEMLLEVAERIGRELKISFEFVNIGGGLGIPYRPEESPLALEDMSAFASTTRVPTATPWASTTLAGCGPRNFYCAPTAWWN